MGLYKQSGCDVWYMRFSVNGKLYRRSTKTTKKADAERVLREAKNEIDAGHIEVEAVETRSWTRGVGGRTTRGRRAARREFEDYSQEEVSLNAGARVTHPSWGDGVVLEVAGSGLDAVVRVRFTDDTEKRIMVRYGKLEIIED